MSESLEGVLTYGGQGSGTDKRSHYLPDTSGNMGCDLKHHRLVYDWSDKCKIIQDLKSHDKKGFSLERFVERN